MAAQEAKNPLVIDVPSELFAPAESSSFSGTYDPGVFPYGPDEYTAASPLAWHALISNVGGALLVSGSITGTVRTSCARCLEDAVMDVSGEVEGYFIIEGEGDAPDDMDEDEFDILPESHQIDMEPLLHAAMLVDLPLVPLCDEECKGICSTCGANLNEGLCGCAADEDEGDGIAANNPFAALKNLKLD